MTLSFHIPTALRVFSGGAERVELNAPAAGTVQDALAALYAQHPGLRDRVQDERGIVRAHVQVFVGAESIRYTGGLATPLTGDRAEISILPAVSGGC